MNDVNTISRVIDRDSMHFRALRGKGIKKLQSIAAGSWSDHNLHDPGITILEAVCYVITEIANQLNFSFEDLIATPAGIAEGKINYPTAADILPSKAVTIIDFRKIILDLPEIRNAYFDVTNESRIDIYYYPSVKELKYEDADSVSPVLWGGLYAIQLEMENEELNSNSLLFTVTVPVNQTKEVSLSFKFWDEVTPEWFSGATISSIALEDTMVALEEDQFEDYYSEWTVTFSDGSVVADFPVWIKLVVPLPTGDPLIAIILNALTTALTTMGPTNPFVLFKSRLAAVHGITKKVKDVYLANRNLGEDISFFTASRLQEIAIDASLEILPVSDPEQVYAEIIFAIENFFSPRPHFQSLDALMSHEDAKVDDIFLGPLLSSGFLSEENLLSFSSSSVIYVSDLVHIILDVEGAATLRDISLTTYFNNFQAVVNERNCIKIQKGFKPKLSIPRTTIELTRNGVPITIDPLVVEARLAILRANASTPVPPGLNDLQIPFGILPERGEYRSLQYELPAIYGTGNAGISSSSSPERVALLKQLQGYLFLFDQLLANTFSQLANVGDLFSVTQERTTTYHHQTLYHLPGAKDIIEHLSGGFTWQQFTALADNSYTKKLDAAGEPGDTFFERRNAMLDYLLARTAENREGFVAILSTLPGDHLNEIILTEKEKFLKKYPPLSMARAQGYNYALTNGTLPDVWNTLNVGGYTKMVVEKLGLASAEERNLFHPITENFEFFNFNLPPVKKKYRMKNNALAEVMTSQNHFDTEVLAAENLSLFLELAKYKHNYEISESSPGNFTFEIKAANVHMVYSGASALATRQAALTTIESVIEIVLKKYSLDGIHVVEHILLRPKIKGPTLIDSDKLIQPLTIEDDILKDPYSHVVTVVLPSGYQRDFSGTADAVPATPGYRWRDAGFRMFAQQTILREAPSHLLLNIRFLDIDTAVVSADDRPSLQNFEKKWKEWREANADPTASLSVKRDTQRKLVTVLQKIYAS